MSNDNNTASDSFEADVEFAENKLAEINAQYELQDQEDFVIVEALSILEKRAKKYGQVFTCETLAIGTIDSATVSIREIAKLALQHNASAVVLGHNHPSGDTTPS